MAGRVLALAKVAYTDPAKRGDAMVQAQLAEWFTDALHNLIRVDGTSDSTETFDDVFALAKTEAFLTRLWREATSVGG